MGERVLVVGNGGRECALASQLLADDLLEKVYITPPNLGVVDLAKPGRTERIGFGFAKPDDHQGVLELVEQERIGLVVIGPEAPIVAGLGDKLREAGVLVVAPSAPAAQLEGSKGFAKAFMKRHGIPTAEFRAFDDYPTARRYLEECPLPVAVKADGLAGGKGVLVTGERKEALDWLEQLMVKGRFGQAGSRVVIEEALSGPEISFHALVDGSRAVLFPTATDYKRLLDGDQGPNTGGMGSIAPSPFAGPEVVEEFRQKILAPFLKGLTEDGLDYRGVAYFGTMLTDQGLRVIEINVRFGDPETQVMLKLLKSPLFPILRAVAQGRLDEVGEVEFYPGSAGIVVMASQGYPFGKSEPVEIFGLDKVGTFNRREAGASAWLDPELSFHTPPVQIVFAGVSLPEGVEPTPELCYDGEQVRATYLASGGRVLGVVARGPDLSRARLLAYQVVNNIHFKGARCRSDIGLIR